jgi:hypothetical protein
VQHPVKGAAVVPLACTNAHNYEIGKPAICQQEEENDGGFYYSYITCSGNHMEYKADCVRAATPEEVTDLVSTLLIEGGEDMQKFLWGLV